MRVVVEGLWGVGKTTLCRYLSEIYGFTYIPEPDHEREAGPIGNLDEWYYHAHLQNYEMAFRVKGSVVIERSVASVFAFAKSRGDAKPLTGRIVSPQTIDVCILLAVQYDTYRTLVKTLPHSIFANPVINSEPFLRSYQPNLEAYITILFPTAMLVYIGVTTSTGLIPAEHVHQQAAEAITRYRTQRRL